MTIRQMARGIAADPRFGWNHIVNSRIVCRSLEGNCLRGLLVDRTSTPGAYVLLAFTQTWFKLADATHHTLSFEFTHHRFGDHTQVADQVAPYLMSDDELRRVVFASPDDPIEISPKAWFRFANQRSEPIWFESIIIRAWDGKSEGLLPELIEVRAELDRCRPGNPYWNRYREAAEELAACLRAGRDPRTVIEPWNQAARAKLKIEPVARMRFAKRT